MIPEEVSKLEQAIEHLTELALKMGLDPYPIVYEIVPDNIIYEFGSYGLPGRFDHWTRGRDYFKFKTKYDYGHVKLYEMILNTNPSTAFLVESNSLANNKLIISHCLGHSSYFKLNTYLKKQPSDMAERVIAHAQRIRQYEHEFGPLEVEKTIDMALSLENHVRPLPRQKKKLDENKKPWESPYADLYPKEEYKWDEASIRFPERSQEDLLYFIATNSHGLKDWQRDILYIIRDEALYFDPLARTKICDEGWATFWHAKLMREADITDEEYTEFAAFHSHMVGPRFVRGKDGEKVPQIDPYALGYKIFEDIEKKGGNVFEVCELEDDVSLIRNYLSKDVCEYFELWVPMTDREGNQHKNFKWKKIRDYYSIMLTNLNEPVVKIEDANYDHNGELFLKHYYDGRPLETTWMVQTLQNICGLWMKRVHLQTIEDNKQMVITVKQRDDKFDLDKKLISK